MAEAKATTVKEWLNDIAAARKREKEWRGEGKRVREIYEGKKKDQIPYNILYSNIETQMPALYGNDPRPLCKRRFEDNDPLGMASAIAGKRLLEYMVDTNLEDYEPFNQVLGDAVLDALLVGRGVSMAKYDADITDTPEAEGQPATSVVNYEVVCPKSLQWDKVVFGFAKKWSKVPWMAIEHDVDALEAAKLFPREKVALLRFNAQESAEEGEPKNGEEGEDAKKTVKVWEIWDKDSKKVIFVTEGLDEALKEDDDPLELSGFFPVPQPISFLRKTHEQLPTIPYHLYENQAKELNRITLRINKIVEALKVRGAYDAAISELEDILKADDNKLVAAQNVASLDEKGLDKAIWLMPIEKLVTVLGQLYIAREQCKQVIYEITGISDILRGASKASETLGAQEIKQTWAGIRLKRAQRDVARYARDLLRIMLEIAAKKFSVKTFQAMTGLPYSTPDQVQQAQVAAQQAQMTGQQPPPEVQAILQKAPWDQVINLLKQDTLRAYRIDIETNSTVDLDATEDKKDMAEMLTAISTFMQGIAPLILQGSMPFEVAKSMLLSVVRRYRFGDEIETMIQQMQPPKPPDDGQKEKAQVELQIIKEEAAAKAEDRKMEAGFKAQEMQRKAHFQEQEHALRMEEMRGKTETARIISQTKIHEANHKLHLAMTAKAAGLNEPAGGAGNKEER